MRTLILLLLSVTFAFPQGLVQRTYLVRAETASFDPHYGFTHFCVLVYPDGKYHLEREKVDTDNKKKYKVYLGQLADITVKELQTTTDDPDFQAIKTPTYHNVWANRDYDYLRVEVPRERRVQDIMFLSVKQRDPYKKTLQSLLSWMKEIEKRKGPAAEEQTANGCSAPLVFYQRSVTDPSVGGK